MKMKMQQPPSGYIQPKEHKGVVTTNWRSVAKSISYRILCTTETFLITWLVTGEPLIATSVALTLSIVKLVTYYVHERIWNTIGWGKLINKDKVKKELGK